METVEVVIRLPKECKEFLDNGGKVDWLDAIPIIDAIANGTVLPKGHGRLIDADELYLDIQTDEEMRLGEENLLWVRERIYDVAPTIIEADREVQDEK